jgi:lysozyme family protein
MSVFDKALAKVLGIEGGFSDDPKDSGGATRWGVTEALARQYGYRGPMQEYPKNEAIRIYREEFWQKRGLAEVAEFSEALAIELFEQIINGVPGGLHLQRQLNALNNGGAVYDDLKTDGSIGPVTRRALFAYLSHRGTAGEKVLLAGLNAEQAVYYRELVERRPKDERFYFGWLQQRVVAPSV